MKHLDHILVSSIKNNNRNKLFLFGIVTFFTIALSTICTFQVASASRGTDWKGWFTLKDNQCVGNGGCDFVFPTGEGATTATSFINSIENKLKNGTNQEKTGAAFIILTMLPGYGPGTSKSVASQQSVLTKFEQTINAYANHDIPGCSVDWNQDYSYTKNTMYDQYLNDVIPYVESSQKTQPAIVFSCGGQTYAIKRSCANPVGDLNPLTTAKWKLTGKSVVDDPTSSSTTQVVHFQHTVTNINDPIYTNSAASYHWEVRGSYNGSAYSINTGYSTPNPSGDRSGTPIGGTGPTDLPDNYIFPSTAKPNDVFCERIYFTHPDGPDSTGERFSARACVTYKPSGGGGPPPTSPTMSCNNFVVPRPAFYGSGSYETRTHYVLTGAAATGGSTISGYIERLSGTGYSSNTTEATYIPNNPDGSKADVNLTTTTEYRHSSSEPWIVENSTGSTGYTAPFNQTKTCYAATCTLSVDGGTGPGGIILTGDTVTIRGQINNPSDPSKPDKQDLPESIPGGQHLSLTTGGSQAHNIGTGVELNTSGPNPPIALGTVTASSNPTAQKISNFAYPDYFGAGGVGPACPDISFNVYEEFGITAVANRPSGDSEDPKDISYITSGSMSTGDPDLDATATSWLTLGPDPASVPVDGKHTATHTYGQGQYDTYTHTVTSINPGDKYCPHIVISPGGGYRAPDGTILGQHDATDDGPCFTVVNRPFVKTFGSGVLAGGDLPGTSCSTDGMIASWNNNSGTNPPPYSYGASTQLSALANLKITGFASAQGEPTRSSHDLSFANRHTPSIIKDDTDSPVTGGNFKGNYCLTVPDPPDGTPHFNDPTEMLGGPDGAKIFDNSIELKGGTVSPNEHKLVYVKGDVYISDSIRYVDASWHLLPNDDVPSYIVVAEGNIYLDPKVDQLDGWYISKKTDGKIYTCGQADYKPVAKDALWDTCYRQLVVHGSLVASHVNLMRTYGSLRNEKPTPGVDPVVAVPGVNQSLKWIVPPLVAKGGVECDLIDEPDDPSWTASATSHKLCLQSVDSADIDVGWTYNAGDIDAARNNTGLSNCTNLGAVNQAPNNYPVNVWGNNWICSNAPVHFRIGDGTAGTNTDNSTAQRCTQIGDENASAGNVWTKTYICIDKPVIKVDAKAPTAPDIKDSDQCSNSRNIDPQYGTCAAEIFDFSPEMYLSKPVIKRENNGAPTYDSITNLPPVL